MGNKILMLLLSVAVIVSFVVVGCAPKAAPPPGEEAAPEVEVITWKGSEHGSPGEPFYDNFRQMCEDITTASQGRLVVKDFPGGSIVPKTEEFDGVDTGALDCGNNCPMYWMGHFPAAGLFDYMVAGLSPMEFLGWLYQRGGGELLQSMIEGYNVHIIPASGTLATPEIFLHSEKPVTKPEDFKGLKIRGAGDGAEVLNRMGASMVFFSHLEIYESMMRGVIDAFECSTPATDYALGMNEVGHYVYLSGVRQPMEYVPFFVNKDKWEELTPELQAVVEDVTRLAAVKVYAKLLATDAEGIQKFIDYGCDVSFLSPEIEAEMSRVADEFYAEKCAEDPFYAEVVESERAYKKMVRETFPRL